MKDEDLFSHDGPPPTASAQERGGDSDRSALSSAHTEPQDAPSSDHPPKTKRRRASRHPLRLLLVAMMVVVLVVLAGGYGVFRALSPTSRQAASAFQQATCPFALGSGLIEGKNVTCGFLTVPEDRSHLQGPTIRLAVAIFKSSSPHPIPDPVFVLGGGPGQALLENQGPSYNVGNLPSHRDLILLDQRGAGYSQPSLRCLDNTTPMEFLPSVHSVRACYDRWVKSGINLNAYTTLENAADVHELIPGVCG
jgi:hypothetical protein